ncbi:hypothetical protein ARMGADRAFT_1022670 [Armillaria gallica]|uniref:Uncharacterized protein n=1 Tax=Armillaria gallica TaxID=47427 RepID=A0A2H3E9W4_ARMGA|nr:hypothetical protein ARMGADRAFT_1022670 [Armillaria gallica]
MRDGSRGSPALPLPPNIAGFSLSSFAIFSPESKVEGKKTSRDYLNDHQDGLWEEVNDLYDYGPSCVIFTHLFGVAPFEEWGNQIKRDFGGHFTVENHQIYRWLRAWLWVVSCDSTKGRPHTLQNGIILVNPPKTVTRTISLISPAHPVHPTNLERQLDILCPATGVRVEAVKRRRSYGPDADVPFTEDHVFRPFHWVSHAPKGAKRIEKERLRETIRDQKAAVPTSIFVNF